jgi:hypothetical protein
MYCDVHIGDGGLCACADLSSSNIMPTIVGVPAADALAPPAVSTRWSERSAVLPLYQGRMPSVMDPHSWFVISYRWWRTWAQYVRWDDTAADLETQMAAMSAEDGAPRPGPMDNTDVAGNDGLTLREGLVENYDYITVPAAVHDLLVAWYSNPGLSFPRQVVAVGTEEQVKF